MSHWLLGSSDAGFITLLTTVWWRCLKRPSFLSYSFCFSFPAFIFKTHLLLIAISHWLRTANIRQRQKSETLQASDITFFNPWSCLSFPPTVYDGKISFCTLKPQTCNFHTTPFGQAHTNTHTHACRKHHLMSGKDTQRFNVPSDEKPFIWSDHLCIWCQKTSKRKGFRELAVL